MNEVDTTGTRQDSRLEQLLDTGSRGPFTRHRLLLGGVLVLLIAVAGWLIMRADDDTTTPRYATEAATIGTLVVKVSATGNLQPTNQVDVGRGMLESKSPDSLLRGSAAQVATELAKMR